MKLADAEFLFRKVDDPHRDLFHPHLLRSPKTAFTCDDNAIFRDFNRIDKSVDEQGFSKLSERFRIECLTGLFWVLLDLRDLHHFDRLQGERIRL